MGSGQGQVDPGTIQYRPDGDTVSSKGQVSNIARSNQGQVSSNIYGSGQGQVSDIRSGSGIN